MLAPDGNIDTDSDGMTNAEECAFRTNADDKDSDNDGFSDYDEVYIYLTDPLRKNESATITENNTTILCPGEIKEPDSSILGIEDPEMGVIGGGGTTTNPNYQGILYYDYKGELIPSLISYKLDFTHFNSSNKIYHQDLAVASSIASAIAYSDTYISISSGGTLTTTKTNDVKDWMEFHGFDHCVNIDLNDKEKYDYNDCHMTQMYVGHKERTINGVTDNIVCVIIRGTNGTLDEWQSNFDVGSTAETPRHNEWTDGTNHRGFDITANRLNDQLKDYLDLYCSGTDIKLWITGHSRGGALANVLADKRIAAGYTVYCYTFASPTTTVYGGAHQSKYDCIFNIINEDDLVPQLPLSTWNFRRYGIDKTMSVEDSCAGEWDRLVSNALTYTSRPTSMQNTVSALQGVSSSRENCYVYRTDTSGYHSITKTTADSRDTALNGQLNLYQSISANLYRVETSNATLSYTARIYQTPGFFMQVLAAVRGGKLTQGTFLALNVAPYLETAKASISWLTFINGTDHPHFTQSYYLLATKIT